MSRIESSPQIERATKSFIEATEYMPDVPLAGMVRFAIDAMDMIDNEEATWEQLVSEPFGKAMAGNAMKRTFDSHRAHGVPDVFKQRIKMDFVVEMVQSGVNRAIALLADGDDSVPTKFFEEVNPNETTRASEFLEEKANREVVKGLMVAIAQKLGEDDHLAKLDEYKGNITKVSKLFSNVKPNHPRYESLMKRKDGKMNRRRGEIMSVAGPKVMEALAPYIGMRLADKPLGVEAFGNALVKAIPSKALFAKHKHPSTPA